VKTEETRPCGVDFRWERDMGKIWTAAVTWFQGKKSILGGGLVMAAAVAGVWFGKLDPVSALTVFGIGFGMCGFAAKLNRHQAELLTALQGVSQAGTDLRSGDKSKLLSDIQTTAGDLAPAVATYAATNMGTTLHISGAAPEDIAEVLRGLIAAPAATRIPVEGTAK
jgi:hypothetical protein